MTSGIRYTILIPALNEEKTIGGCVQKALRFLKKICKDGEGAEVLVSDNGSRDKTREIAERSGARVICVNEKGYGRTLLAGFRSALGRSIVMADADDSYHFEEAGPFFEKLEQGYDLVLGNRFRGKIAKAAMPPLHRYLGTPALTLLAQIFFNVKIGDINCGMRGITRDAFRRLHLKTGGMEFATEMIAKAAALGMKITEIPCNLYPDQRGRKPHLRSWQDGWRHLRFMLLFKTRWTFFIPGFILSIAGVSGMSLILLRDLLTPGRLSGLDSKHILSCMMVFLTGTQVALFGMMAEAYSFSRRFDFGSQAILAIRKWFSLEKGILWGSAVMLAGSFIFTYLAVSFYTDLLPSMTGLLRMDAAGFAIAFFLFGIQLIFASFALSFFYLKIK